jgi:hypothetical protein
MCSAGNLIVGNELVPKWKYHENNVAGDIPTIWIAPSGNDFYSFLSAKIRLAPITTFALPAPPMLLCNEYK